MQSKTPGMTTETRQQAIVTTGEAVVGCYFALLPLQLLISSRNAGGGEENCLYNDDLLHSVTQLLNTPYQYRVCVQKVCNCTQTP